MILKKIKVGGKIIVALALLCRVSPATAEGGAADEANGYAGDERCMDCHSDKAVAGPHAKTSSRDTALALYSDRTLTGPHGAVTNPKAPAAKDSCETCHGPALQHAKFQEDNDDKNAVDPTLEVLRIGLKSSSSSDERNGVCLQCHTGGNQALWDGSIHEQRGVSCTDCHSPHSKNQKYLKGGTQAESCATCHKDIKAELQRNSHHPIREGKMDCSDCHNVHGTIADKLISANTVNEKCYECHAEKRGPFIWDHAPVQENCMTCHTAHGSTHDALLIQKVPFLCQTCHSNSGHPGTLYAIPSGASNKSPYVMLNNMAFNRACMDCHVAVHGSNSPSGMSLTR
jgi:DmsE family decaheme c-type cytochrome